MGICVQAYWIVQNYNERKSRQVSSVYLPSVLSLTWSQLECRRFEVLNLIFIEPGA